MMSQIKNQPKYHHFLLSKFNNKMSNPRISIKHNLFQITLEFNLQSIQTYTLITNKMEIQTNSQNKKYPYSILWTKLPCISAFMPCIGHIGVCQSDGTVFDYLGPYIHSGQLGFGQPTKVLILQVKDQDSKRWDWAILEASKYFSKKQHKLFTNNCHHHVAQVLNIYEYQGKKNWSQYDVWKLTLKARKIRSDNKY